MLRYAKLVHMRSPCSESLTTRVGNSGVELVWRMWEVRRKMDPMGTGFAKEIPSSERKRTWLRVKSEELVKPSYGGIC